MNSLDEETMQEAGAHFDALFANADARMHHNRLELVSRIG